MIFSYADALRSLFPLKEWAVVGDDYSNIQWFDASTPKPSEEILKAEIKRLTEEYEYLEYQRLREREYPSIQQQLDMQYWDSVNGTTTWQDAINAVKAKYPKPEGV